MLNKSVYVLLLLLTASLSLTIAWPASSAPPAKSSETSFLPQAVPLDEEIVGSGIGPGQLLDKALERLTPERTPWLKTKIKQTMTDSKTNFIAEGFLQRGPRNCARLELEVISRGQRGKLLIISDGNLIADVKKIPKFPPVERVAHLLPEDISTSPADGASAEVNLNNKGCGGPAALLEQMKLHLQNAGLQTGLLQGTPVVRIKGDLPTKKLPVFAMTSIPVRVGCVYLDAKTLWPVQFEWWGVEKDQSMRSILQIEFREPELNHPLTLDECVRLFSYRPEGNAGTVDVE